MTMYSPDHPIYSGIPHCPVEAELLESQDKPAEDVEMMKAQLIEQQSEIERLRTANSQLRNHIENLQSQVSELRQGLASRNAPLRSRFPENRIG